MNPDGIRTEPLIVNGVPVVLRMFTKSILTSVSTAYSADAK